jgi:hypothetical protein
VRQQLLPVRQTLEAFRLELQEARLANPIHERGRRGRFLSDEHASRPECEQEKKNPFAHHSTPSFSIVQKAFLYQIRSTPSQQRILHDTGKRRWRGCARAWI